MILAKIFQQKPLGTVPDQEHLTASEYGLSAAEATRRNMEGYGVTFYPNDLVGGRKAENVTKINCWYVDVDFKDCEKPSLEDVLALSPIYPSLIVETKNGYHIYYQASNASVGEAYTLQQQALIDFFGGDEKCKNANRMLRAPGYYHMKDKDDPFLVQSVYITDATYTWQQMRLVFPWPEPEEEAVDKVHTPANEDNLFDKIRHYNSRIILSQLSGSSYVGGKQYKFKRTSRGRYNIIVDGKDSGCFINEKGNVIGSKGYSGGAIEWLTWYGLDRTSAMKAVKDVMGW